MTPIAEAVTADDGRFSLGAEQAGARPSFDADYLVEASSAHGRERSWPVLIDSECLGSTEPIELELRSVPSVLLVAQGVLADADRTEFFCFRTGPVGARTRKGQPGSAYPFMEVFQADAAGRREAQLLPGMYWLSARAGPAGAWGDPERVEVHPNDTPGRIELPVALGACSCLIEVVDERGEPISGAWISFAQGDQALRLAVSESGPMAERAGAGLTATGWEGVFAYANANGRLGLILPANASREIAIGSPFHLLTTVTIDVQTADHTRTVRLADRPRILATVHGSERLSLEGLPLTWGIERMDRGWQQPYPRGSAGDFLYSALTRAFVRSSSNPDEHEVLLPAYGRYHVCAALPGSARAQGAVAVDPERRTVRLHLEFPRLQRIRLRFSPIPDEDADRFARHPVDIRLYTPNEDKSGKIDAHLPWRALGEWTVPSQGYERELWMREGNAAVLVAGATVLDDLPGLPALLDTGNSRGGGLEVPIDLAALGWLEVTVEEAAPGVVSDNLEVRIERVLAPEDRTHAMKPFLRRAHAVWHPCEKGSFVVPLTPGNYSLRARTGRALADPTFVRVSAGSRASITLPHPR